MSLFPGKLIVEPVEFDQLFSHPVQVFQRTPADLELAARFQVYGTLLLTQFNDMVPFPRGLPAMDLLEAPQDRLETRTPGIRNRFPASLQDSEFLHLDADQLIFHGNDELSKPVNEFVDMFDGLAVLPHAVMGATAGWTGRTRSEILSSATILVGHTLNMLFYLRLGLMTISVENIGGTLLGLTVETTIGIIAIILAIALLKRWLYHEERW